MSIVDERNEAYADAWCLHGEVIKPVAEKTLSLLWSYPYMFFPWMLILNKLLRILGSPTNEDHWVDIRGYAELVLTRLREAK